MGLTQQELEKIWERDGGCRSCNFYPAFYEVSEMINDSIDHEDIEPDGTIIILCCEDSSHRGHKLYLPKNNSHERRT